VQDQRTTNQPGPQGESQTCALRLCEVLLDEKYSRNLAFMTAFSEGAEAKFKFARKRRFEI
jgi:hypothetical protein